MSDTLEFDDLAPTEIKVRIGKDHYLLREASTDAATKYRNAQIAAMRVSDGKVTGMAGIADTDPLLVSLCLFPLENGVPKLDRHGWPVNVPISFVRGLRNKITKVLVEKIRSISDLDEEDTEESLSTQISLLQDRLAAIRQTEDSPVKNELNSTTVNSD